MQNKILNFLDLPAPLSRYDSAKVAVLCLPYEATTTYGKGTGFGPQAIIDASHQVELYDEELGYEPCEVGITTQLPLNRFSLDPSKAIEQISNACEKLIANDKFVIALGGEHTVSVGLVQAFKKFYSDMWVLQLDAHSDLRNEYESSKFNHACVMARISEFCPFIGLGIRSTIANEAEFVKPPTRVFYAHELYRKEDWFELIDGVLGEHVYLTIDLDFFDPSVLPSVGTPEPGGFQWYETLTFLKKVAQSRKVIGVDVVELSPRSGFPASDFFAAKLVYKLIGYILHNGKKNTPKKVLDS